VRSLLRFGVLSFALTVLALPLVIGGGGSVADTVYSTPATVSASSWSTMASEVVAETNYPAGAVSCVTSAFCLAATGFGGYGLGGHDYMEQWTGTGWIALTLPSVPGAASTTLIGVSCVTISFCVAVGQTSGPAVLVEQFNGRYWTVVTTSIGEATQLYSVSCLSVTFCEAVGDTGGSQAGPPIAAEWNGSTWSAQTISLPGQLTSGSLVSTSCTTPSFCTAVGYGYDQGSDETPLAYTWNGSNWTASSISNGGLFYPNSVSCAGLNYCAATASNPGQVNQVVFWNGSTWSPAQNVAGAGTLYGISCFSPTSCTAVGASGTNTEVLNWNGQSWTQDDTPPTGAAGSASAFLFGVDCLTDWACVAAGASEFTSSPPTTYLPLLAMAPIARSGYRFVGSDGGVYTYGPGAPFLGSMGGIRLNWPVVDMATMPGGDGYYLVGADGGVFNFGSAQFYGSMGGQPLNKPIVGIAVTPDGGGYWLVASDGGVFSFGDAQFYGSMGGKTLNKPIVGIAPSPNGNGYYEVASDGGIFTFPTVGGPPFNGSTGSLTLNKPVVGMAVASDGGYYEVAADGGVFNYPFSEGFGPETSGAAPFYGSTGSIKLNKPIVGMDLVGNGYYLGAADGGVFAFPTSNGPPFLGSRGGQPINALVVAISG